jgi:hypothetical protein
MKDFSVGEPAEKSFMPKTIHTHNILLTQAPHSHN